MELYRSSTLCVRSYQGNDDNICAVTFDDYGSANGLERDGFGHRFFEQRGIMHVTVLAAGTQWYNYPDIRDALDVARAAVAGAKRIMTYGSSMGGYAALRFAAHLGATSTLALSPQFTIHPRRVPFDKRWVAEGRQIVWERWVEAPIQLTYRPLIISDGRGLDARHVRLIAAETCIDHVALNYTAHPVSTYLSNVSLLEEAVLRTLDGTLDLADYRKRAESARHSDPIYLGELARVQPSHRRRTGLSLAYRALNAAPNNALVRNNLAIRLRSAGELTEALQHHERAAALSNGAFGYEFEHCVTLRALGDERAACMIAARLALQEPSNPHILAWAAQLVWECGSHEQALAYAEAAHRVAPKSKYFARLWNRYRRRHAFWRYRLSSIVQHARAMLG